MHVAGFGRGVAILPLSGGKLGTRLSLLKFVVHACLASPNCRTQSGEALFIQ
jgi:hypothetical protein